jgi:hypothetical protein
VAWHLQLYKKEHIILPRYGAFAVNDRRTWARTVETHKHKLIMFKNLKEKVGKRIVEETQRIQTVGDRCLVWISLIFVRVFGELVLRGVFACVCPLYFSLRNFRRSRLLVRILPRRYANGVRWALFAWTFFLAFIEVVTYV